ncbi:hypothetical protein Tco_0239894, partial [Tanacetum coccineum]
IQVKIRSSSTAPAGHNLEDFVLSRIRSDLDAFHGRVRVIEKDNIRAENKRLRMMLESGEECISSTRKDLARVSWDHYYIS